MTLKDSGDIEQPRHMEVAVDPIDGYCPLSIMSSCHRIS